jgi:hypothetical protein
VPIAAPGQLKRYTRFARNKMKTLLAIALLTILPMLGRAQNSKTVPANWQKTEACGIALYLPPDMKAPHKGALGLDECIESFENGSFSILVETNPFGSLASKTTLSRFKHLVGKPKFTKVDTRVAARKAVLVTYEEPNPVEGFRYQMALSVAAKGGMRVFASMKNVDDRETAERILRSLAFVP